LFSLFTLCSLTDCKKNGSTYKDFLLLFPGGP
jgi:hypothetical protein